MTQSELSLKICEGLSAIFGKVVHSPESWLESADYAKGTVTVIEHATCPRDATSKCLNLESFIGNCHVTAAPRFAESYAFTIAFPKMKNEAVYSDGKNAIATMAKNGKQYAVDASGNAVEISNPDTYVANINKSTGSHYKKVEEYLPERIAEANAALDGTGFTIESDGNSIAITGAKEVLCKMLEMLPSGDEYDGSGYDADKNSLMLIIPDGCLYPEEIGEFLDKVVCLALDSETPEEVPETDWNAELAKAVPDERIARRSAFVKDYGKELAAMSAEAFAQAVVSANKVYGIKTATHMLESRVGHEKAVELAATLPKTESVTSNTNTSTGVTLNVIEAALDKAHAEFVGARTFSTKTSKEIIESMNGGING